MLINVKLLILIAIKANNIDQINPTLIKKAMINAISKYYQLIEKKWRID
jgi:hypothetical protein